MNKYMKTVQLSAIQKINGGVVHLLPGVVIKACTLIPLIFLWRVVMSSGVEVGMSPCQMLSYTYISALLADLLVVRTAASEFGAIGALLKLYGRPSPILGQLAAETVGRWIPTLVLFSLPMAALAPAFGVNLIPQSPLFLPSLALCVSLGFAVDCLFACLAIRLRNMDWTIDGLRMAVVAIFSGTVIPIKLLPFGLAEVMKYQPFACLGGAPLSLFVGSADAYGVLALQVFWNVVLWPLALLAFHHSQEGVVSYGG